MTPDELIAERKAAGLSSTQLAAKLGIHERTLARWEAGEYPIPKPAVIAIRALLDGTVEAQPPAPVVIDLSKYNT